MSNGLATKIWETALNEHVAPVIDDEGGLAVAFYVGHKLQFIIPVGDREAQAKVVMSFQNVFSSVFNRYVELANLLGELGKVKEQRRAL